MGELGGAKGRTGRVSEIEWLWEGMGDIVGEMVLCLVGGIRVGIEEFWRGLRHDGHLVL